MPAPAPLGPLEPPVTAWVVYLPEDEARRLASPEGAPRDGEGRLLPGCIGHLGDGEVRLDARARESLWCSGLLVRGEGGEILALGEKEYPVFPDV